MRRSRLATTDERLLWHPRETIYRILCDIGSYREWWPDADGLGVVGPLPPQVGTTLRLSYGPFVRWTAEVAILREPDLIAMTYAGALQGVAAWRITADPGASTRVAYAIDIEPVPSWLKLVFALWNLQPEHSRQIGRVFDALELRIGAVTARETAQACPAVRSLPNFRSQSATDAPLRQDPCSGNRPRLP